MAKKNKDDKVIREIIDRYGDKLDLKRSPYLILEIIRLYGPRIDPGHAAECAPPGGPPKSPDWTDLIRELKTKVAETKRLSAALEKLLKANTKKAR